MQFSYNLLNLPSKVEGSAGSGNAGLTLSYGYLSDGTKTSSVTGTGSNAGGLKYRGSFVYELKDGAERISSIGWSEGRTEYVYAPFLVEDGDVVLEGPEDLLEIDDLWYIPDHLGNTRTVVLMDWNGGTVIERNEYLPFGTRIDGTLAAPNNRYRFAGKEEQRFGYDIFTGAYKRDLALLDFSARYYDPFSARWTTRDPLAGKYHSLSPYNYCISNPINLFDPQGLDVYLFDEDGNFVQKIEMDGTHRIAIQSKDSYNNLTMQFYDFADAENDPADIDRGAINHIQFVSEESIKEMIDIQGGNEATLLNFGFRSSGGKSYDYSTGLLKDKYPVGTKHNRRGNEITSNSLFIPEGDRTAHNLMNFGNYLWGATGFIAGYDIEMLKLGANVNSLVNPRTNGYSPQFDSPDDQLSIELGYYHAKNNKYKRKSK